jgi:TetR/AcrR family transcriptional regulator, transcriptional repressor for nem operon
VARPQEFDTAEALRSAMRLFWDKGYEATSLTDILAATGLSKSSLYATFGDKRELFLAAFSAYRQEHMCQLRAMLNDGRPARQSIEAFFRQGVAHAGDDAHSYGCMTANEAVELAPHDAEIQHIVAEDFRTVEDAFAEAISRGQDEGSIASRQDNRMIARFLVVNLQGLQVMARARIVQPNLDDAVTVMMAAFD